MGLNFKKSLKIAPGVKLNIGKKGINSVSVGKNGAKLNVGKNGVRTTVGIPDSGLSYSKNHSSSNRNIENANSSLGFVTLLFIGLFILVCIIWILV